MNKQPISPREVYKRVGILLTLGLFLVGCTSSTSQATTTNTQIPLPLATRFLPSETPTTSPTLTPTVTQTSNPTITPLPTLSQEDAIQEIAELMRTNAGCTTPCFWGFSPFMNSISETQNFFRKFSGELGVYKSGLLNCFYPDLSFQELRLGIGFCEKSGDSHHIEVDLRGLEESDISNQDWLAFRPESILKTYGLPSYIRIIPGRSPTLPGQVEKVGFIMIFIYEQQQFILEYQSDPLKAVPVVNSIAHICPLVENEITQFDLWLGKDPPDHWENKIELVDEVSMTINEVYDLFLGDPDKACFNLNLESLK